VDKALVLHGRSPWCLQSNPPGKAGNRRKTTLWREDVFFRLTRGLISGKFGLLRTRNSPVSTGITARHWRALLFLGFAISEELERARRGNRAA